MSKRSAACPHCRSVLLVRDGKTEKGKQRYRCRLCGRGFVAHRDGIRQEYKDIALSLIKSGVPVPTIVKAMGRHCSRRWLYNLRADLINVSK